MKDKIIVAFHIGRGGRFNNQGFKTFIGEKKIGDFTDNLFLEFQNQNNFKNRFGYDKTYGSEQKCIVDLITDKNFDELEEKFGISELDLGHEIYIDSNGNSVGLYQYDVESGIGCIDIDGAYNTTYTCLIEDCDEEEIRKINESSNYKSIELITYLETLNL